MIYVGLAILKQDICSLLEVFHFGIGSFDDNLQELALTQIQFIMICIFPTNQNNVKQ